MNIILFGPPGIGKSTIISILKSLGQRAIDLEDMYPSRVRFQMPNQLDDVFLGAADLTPARKYPNSKKVLLIADQSTYDARRADRDAKVSGKSNQAHHDVDKWREADYDLIIDTSKLSPKQVAQTLLKERRKANE